MDSADAPIENLNSLPASSILPISSYALLSNIKNAPNAAIIKNIGFTKRPPIDFPIFAIPAPNAETPSVNAFVASPEFINASLSFPCAVLVASSSGPFTIADNIPPTTGNEENALSIPCPILLKPSVYSSITSLAPSISSFLLLPISDITSRKSLFTSKFCSDDFIKSALY